MRRQAVQTALGCGGLAVEGSRIATAVTAHCQRGRQPFSTSTTLRSDDNESNNKYPSSRERSQAAASAIRKLTGKPKSPARDARRDSASIDARALGNMLRAVPVDATKVVSLRNLRGPIGGTRPAGGQRGLDKQPLGSRIDQRTGDNGGALRRGGGFRAAGRPGLGGRTGGTSFRARAGRGRGPKGKREKKPKASEANEGKLKWSPEEKAILDRLDQGEVTEYKPRVALEDLCGYGPAVATDVALGKIELAMQAMRILGGGGAFNSDLSPTADSDGILKRYSHEGKPVFFNSVAEKEWVGWALKGKARMAAPDEAFKKSVIETVVQGKYEMQTGFVDVTDTVSTVASYHNQTFAYKPSDSMVFLDKVKALLPAETKTQPAAARKRA